MLQNRFEKAIERKNLEIKEIEENIEHAENKLKSYNYSEMLVRYYNNFIEESRNNLKKVEEEKEYLINVRIPEYIKEHEEKTIEHFKRHGFANCLEIRNKNFYVSYNNGCLEIDVKSLDGEQVTIFREKNINTLEQAKQVIENELSKENFNIEIDISFIESYYIGCKNNDVDIEEFYTIDNNKKKIIVSKDMTILELLNDYNVDLNKTLDNIYSNFKKIKDIFNVSDKIKVNELFQFIHDNNYKLDFREKFIAEYIK